MASHFACIGIPSALRDDLTQFIDTIFPIATPPQRADGARLLAWNDTSGASLYLHLNEQGSIECLTPSFCGLRERQVKAKAIVPDERCRFCDVLHVEVLDDKGEMFYPLLLQVEDVEAIRDRIEPEKIILLRVTGFAEDLQSWPEEEAFHASQESQKLKYATQSRGPSGMFNTPWTPHAFMTGKVVESNSMINTQSGIDFLHLVVDSYGGAYDVVAPSQAHPIEPGAIVRCSCWMVGSLNYAASN